MNILRRDTVWFLAVALFGLLFSAIQPGSAQETKSIADYPGPTWAEYRLQRLEEDRRWEQESKLRQEREQSEQWRREREEREEIEKAQKAFREREEKEQFIREREAAKQKVLKRQAAARSKKQLALKAKSNPKQAAVTNASVTKPTSLSRQQTPAKTGKQGYDYEVEMLKNRVRDLESRVQSLEYSVRDLQDHSRNSK